MSSLWRKSSSIFGNQVPGALHGNTEATCMKSKKSHIKANHKRSDIEEYVGEDPQNEATVDIDETAFTDIEQYLETNPLESGEIQADAVEGAAVQKKLPYLELVAQAIADIEKPSVQSDDRSMQGTKCLATPSIGSVLELEGLTSAPTCVVYSDNIVYVGNANGNILLYSVETRMHVRTLEGHDGSIRCIQVDVDPERGTTWIYTASSKGEVRRWRKNGKCIKTIPVHEMSIHGLSVSSKQQLLFTASADKTAKVADYRSGEILMTFVGHTDEVWCVHFTMLKSKLGNVPSLFTGSEDCSIIQWEIESGQCIRRFSGHNDPVRCLDVDGLQGLLLSGDTNGTMKKWRIRSGFELLTYTGHSGAIRRVLIDCNEVISASADATVRRWDLRDGRLVTIFPLHDGAMWAQLFDGYFLVVASFGSDPEEAAVRAYDMRKCSFTTLFRPY